MKFAFLPIASIECLLILICCQISFSGTQDILKSDHKHRTQKATERINKLKCFRCHTLNIFDSYCMNVTANDTSLQEECEGDVRTCMVKRISYTTTTDNLASEHKIWSLERNCSQKCESGCIIIGERLKLYQCTSCCDEDFCNSGNGASVSVVPPFVLILLFTNAVLFIRL